MAKAIFLITLVLGCLFQWQTLTSGMTDDVMWADQARFVETGNPQEFNFLAAYGHPGGPIVEGTIMVHDVFHVDYDEAINVFLSLLGGLVIAASCTLCFLMKKDSLWWVPVFATLALSPLYNITTPPSELASLLSVFIVLLTIYLFEKGALSTRSVIFWAVVAGFFVATRIDIGCVITAACLVVLLPVWGWKRIAAALAPLFASFCFFDPFMWFMPVQHIKDLVWKTLFHYSDIGQNYLPLPLVAKISLLAFVGIAFGLVFLFVRTKNGSPVPRRAIIVFIVMTAVLYVVFLTAHSQAERYFQPLIFLWEVFLSLFTLRFVSEMDFDFLRSEKAEIWTRQAIKVFIVALFLAYPICVARYSFAPVVYPDNYLLAGHAHHAAAK